jgi:hypothetical protein
VTTSIPGPNDPDSAWPAAGTEVTALTATAAVGQTSPLMDLKTAEGNTSGHLRPVGVGRRH